MQKNENRALKLQLDEKISEKGVKTVKIGFQVPACACRPVSAYVGTPRAYERWIMRPCKLKNMDAYA